MTAHATRVPLASTAELGGALRRARVLRLALAAALAVTAALALALALHYRTPPSLVPRGSDGVVVLDVSGSVGAREYRQLSAALAQAARGGHRYGLVAFSDDAYEVFAPGTDTEQVRAVRRFVEPAPGAARRLGVTTHDGRTYLESPWTGSFSGGTRISRALALARRIVLRDRLVHPSVVLVSDLDTDPRDVTATERVAAGYHRAGIQLRVVGLGPRSRTRRFVETVVDTVGGPEDAAMAVDPAPPDAAGAAAVRAPVLLAAAGVLLLALLAVNELACRRLEWAPSEAA